MEKNIINSLILCRQEFDKKFDNFAYKQDLDAVFQHEYENYLMPLCEDIIPLIFKNIREDSKVSVEDYFPYISPKYHGVVKKELMAFEKKHDNATKNIVKHIADSFSAHLIQYGRYNEKEKNDSLNDFFDRHAKDFNEIVKNDPLSALTLCSKLRNPRFQNILIIKFKTEFSDLINSKNKQEFENEILQLFAYPKGIEVKEYYNKWIAREALHVKICKGILGDHYEDAKKTLKYLEQSKKVRKSKEN